MARYPGVRKRGNAWYVFWRRAGVFHQERTEAQTAREAAEIRLQLLKRFDRGELLPRAERLDPVGPRLSDLIALTVGEHSSDFEKNMAAVVNKRFGDSSLCTITPVVVERWEPFGNWLATIRKK